MAKDPLTFHVEGEPYTLDDLTFREQIRLRAILKLIVPEDLDDPPLAALMPAAVVVITERLGGKLTIEEALSMKWGDLDKKSARPTRRKAAATGTPVSTP